MNTNARGQLLVHLLAKIVTNLFFVQAILQDLAWISPKSG